MAAWLRQRAWQGALALGAALALAYVVASVAPLPAARAEHTQALLWLLTGALGVLGVLAGTALHRPPGSGAWLLIAGAMLLNLVGDAMRMLPTWFGYPGEPAVPSAVDAVYLASYAALALGVFVLVRRRSPGRDPDALLDALILTTAVGLLSWRLLIHPLAVAGGTDPATTVVTVLYPLMDLVVLAAAARLWFGVDGGTNRSLDLLVLGLLSTLLSDTAYSAAQLAGTWQDGTPADIGWLGFYVLLAAAALEPSVARPPVPAREEGRVTTWRLVALLSVVSLMPPLLVLGDGGADVPELAVILLGTAAMFTLVLLRLRALVGTLRGTLRRERVLRDANAALSAANDRDGIRRAAIHAVLDLLGRGHKVALVVREQRGTAVAGEVVAASDGDVGVVLSPQALRQLDEHADPVQTFGGPSLVHSSMGVPADRSLVVAPLVEHHTTTGYLVTVVEEPPRPEVLTSLATLANSVSLATARVELGRLVAERHTERRVRRMLQHSSDVIAVLDLGLAIRYVTPAAEKLVGSPAHFLTGSGWLDLVFPADLDAARDLMERASGDRSSHGEIRLLSRDGSQRYVEVVVTRVTDREEPGYVLTCHDVTERRRLEQQLAHQAFHDTLTGLANRALFVDRLDHALVRAHRGRTRFAVLFLDLDDFKTVNDSLGHAAGDLLLRQVTHRLSACLREEDTAARLGGDEFAILIEDVEDDEQPTVVAQRILDALALPFEISGSDVTVGASVGIALGSAETVGSDEAMRNADLALYDAKNAGKGRWAEFVQDMHDAAVDRLQLKADLRRGLEEGELVVHYQPVFDMNDDSVVGVEALARWRHPTRGLLGPGQFVGLAEETGLVVPLGRSVMRDAFGAVARWQRRWKRYRGLLVTVNVSVRQLQQDEYVDDVRAALLESKIRPETVILEITESVLMPGEGVTLERLQSLTGLGVRLFIDDFGTGYSSLSYLQQLPVHGIKLAREFVATLPGGPEEPSSTGLVSTIRSLAETLGLAAVIAEGVETAEQREALLDLGYHLGQGFLLSPPMPADAMSLTLASRVGTRRLRSLVVSR